MSYVYPASIGVERELPPPLRGFILYVPRIGGDRTTSPRRRKAEKKKIEKKIKQNIQSVSNLPRVFDTFGARRLLRVVSNGVDAGVPKTSDDNNTPHTGVHS